MDEGVELYEGVGSQVGGVDLRGGVGGGEFRGDVGKIRKGKFAWIGTVAYTEEADVILDQIAGIRNDELAVSDLTKHHTISLTGG